MSDTDIPPDWADPYIGPGSPAAWTCPTCRTPAIPDMRYPGAGLLVAQHSPGCMNARPEPRCRGDR